MKMKKALSDGEVNDTAYSRLMGDLDGIEAHGMFDEGPVGAPQAHEDGVKMETGGYSIHVKPMNGEQTRDMPKIEDEDEEKDELGKLGL